MRDKFNLKSSFEIIGNWWLLGNPEHKISGILKFTPKRTLLELNGSFDQGRLHDLQFRDFIHGDSQDGILTLFQCSPVGRHTSNGIDTVTYSINYIFIGAYFANESQIIFDAVDVSFSRLNSWVQTHGFDSSPRGTNSISISYTQPESIPAVINETMSLSIGFSVQDSFHRGNERRHEISENVLISLASKKKLNLYEFLKLIQHLRNFFSLAIMGPEHPISIVGYSDQFFQDLGIGKIPKPIQIIYSQGDLPDTSYYNLGNMMFVFEQISDNFELYVKNWFERIDTLGIVGNLYFGTLYNQYSYLNEKLLGVFTSLESFHRIFRDGKIWSDDYFSQLKSKIINSVPEKDKSDVGNRFRYANEFTLRRRLKDLVHEFNYILTPERGYDEDFVGLIVDTRNYYAHYDLASKDHTIQDQNLPRFISRLRVLVEACFLSEMGFNKEKITSFLQKSMIVKGVR